MLWRREGEWRYSSTILDLSTRWKYRLASLPRRFILGERAPGIHWIGSRAGLNAVEKRKRSCCRCQYEEYTYIADDRMIKEYVAVDAIWILQWELQ
jgi:hypothetical protein